MSHNHIPNAIFFLFFLCNFFFEVAKLAHPSFYSHIPHSIFKKNSTKHELNMKFYIFYG